MDEVVVKCFFFIRLLRFSCVGIFPKFVHARQSAQVIGPLRLLHLKVSPPPQPVSQEGPNSLHPLNRKSYVLYLEAVLYGPKVVVRIRRDMS